MDMFRDRSASMMHFGPETEPFDADGVVYEPLPDGFRALAYLDRGETVLVNGQGRYLLPRLPELAGLHRQAGEPCLLDGQIITDSGRKATYEGVRARLAASAPDRVKRLSGEHPATFVAFDLLYLGNRDTLGLPLAERQRLLADTIAENERLTLSRIFDRGIALFRLAREQDLKGVMARQAGGPYRMGWRGRDWLRFTNWMEGDFPVVGYWPGDRAATVNLVLGRERGGELVYAGHVSLSRRSPDFARILAAPVRAAGAGPTVYWGPKPEKHHKTTWLKPVLEGRVRFLSWTATSLLRQPSWQGLAHGSERGIPEDRASGSAVA